MDHSCGIKRPTLYTETKDLGSNLNFTAYQALDLWQVIYGSVPWSALILSSTLLDSYEADLVFLASCGHKAEV